MRSARRDTTRRETTRRDAIRGGIDKISGRVLEAFGKVTGNRTAVAKGKAARARGAGRLAKRRLKRRLERPRR